MKKYLILAFCLVFFLKITAQTDPHLIWTASKFIESAGAKKPQIKMDKDQNLFVLTTQTLQNPFLGYYLIKYDASGNELWTQYNHSPLGNLFGGFTLDTLGNAFVGCALGGTLPGARGDDAILVKYAPDGTEKWIRNLSLGYEGHSQIENIKFGAGGRLFGLGFAVSTEHESDNLLFLAGFDGEDGHELWRHEVQGYFVVHNLRLLENHLTALLTEYRVDGRYFRILQMDFNGHVLSDHAKPYFTGRRLDFNFISKNGDVVFGNRFGGYHITRVNYQGDTLWNYSLPDCDPCRVLAFAEDDSLAIYATGNWSGDEVIRQTTSKISLQGEIKWQKTYREDDLVSSGADGIGINKKHVYTIGSVGLPGDNTSNLHVMVYDKDTGAEQQDFCMKKDSAAWGEDIKPMDNGFLFMGYSDWRASGTTSVLTGRYDLPVSVVHPMSAPKEAGLVCHPNPAHGEAVLYYDALEASDAQVFFHDAQGRLLDIMDCRFTQGRNAVRLQNLARLPEGIVNISVNDKKGIQSVRIIKQ